MEEGLLSGYPSPFEPTFYEGVYRDARYYQAPEGEGGAAFRINDQQRQFPRYFAPITGIKSALLFHNVGSGKSGTIILSLLQRRNVTGRPALLLVPNDNIRKEFVYEILGREWISSGEEGKSVFRRKFTGDAFINEEMRNILNGMASERAKDALCASIMHKYVEPLLQIQTHNRFDKRVLGGGAAKPMNRDEIVANFSNRDIAVDECHKTRKGKRLYQALKLVAETVTGTTLLMCSATPMIESAHELCSTMNLLLIHDRADVRITPDLVDAFVTRDDPSARQTLMRAFKGRVSFVRGMHPDFFPLRKDHGVTVFPDQPDHRVWPCFMEGRQLKAYLEAFEVECRPNAEAGQRNDVWNITREKARAHVLPSMGKVSTNVGRFVANLDSPDWNVSRMRDLSCKNVEMHRITNELHPVGGPVLIYFANVVTGVLPNEAFWAANGVVPWNPRVAAPAGKQTYVNISGEAKTGTLNQAIKVLKSDRNYDSSVTRYSLASPKVSIGLTMRHHSVGIVTEVSWTRGEIEQLLGRLTRHMSHTHCSDPDASRVVHTYILCAKIRPEDIQRLPDQKFVQRWNVWFAENRDMLQERGFLDERGNLRTLDERTLAVGLERDAGIAKVARLLKEMAVPLNLSQNYFPDEADSYRGTRLYDYMPSPPRIPVPSEHFPAHPRTVQCAPDETDDTFASIDGWWTWCATPQQDVDFFGHIRHALDEALVQRRGITIDELIETVSRQSGATRVDVALALTGIPGMRVDLERGWATTASHGSADPMELWQQSPGVEMAHDFAPAEAVSGLGALMQDHVSLSDVFGPVSAESAPDIPASFDGRYVESDGRATLVLLQNDTVARAGWCGVDENTADSADEYLLKIVSRGGTRQNYSKISAHSKSIASLIELVMQLDGDTEDILDSSRKKTTACEAITAKLKEYGRFLPWTPGETPTLYRALCIARAWKLTDLVFAMEQFVGELVRSGAFLRLCTELFAHRNATALFFHPISEARMVAQIEENVAHATDYVARMIERISRNRPKRFNTQQWTAARKWMTDEVINSGRMESFYAALDESFQARCRRECQKTLPESSKRLKRG